MSADHSRAFTRPLLKQVRGNGLAYAEILCELARDDAALQRNMLEALALMKIRLALNTDAMRDPIRTKK